MVFSEVPNMSEFNQNLLQKEEGGGGSQKRSPPSDDEAEGNDGSGPGSNGNGPAKMSRSSQQGSRGPPPAGSLPPGSSGQHATFADSRNGADQNSRFFFVFHSLTTVFQAKLWNYLKRKCEYFFQEISADSEVAAEARIHLKDDRQNIKCTIITTRRKIAQKRTETEKAEETEIQLRCNNSSRLLCYRVAPCFPRGAKAGIKCIHPVNIQP